MKPTFFASAAELRRWLRKHHSSAHELLVGFYRKEFRRGPTYSEALDAALEFGWIDGVRRKLDAECYSIRFTPRRRGSIWSLVNIRRAQELVAQGRMKPPGLHAFRERDERKARRYSYERERARFDAPAEAALRANPRALAFFEAQPEGYQRTATFWIMSAKREETRSRRLAQLIERSAKGARIDMLNPNRK